jgi:hypothetical protein
MLTSDVSPEDRDLFLLLEFPVLLEKHKDTPTEQKVEREQDAHEHPLQWTHLQSLPHTLINNHPFRVVITH